MNGNLDSLPCCKTASGKHIDCIAQALEKIKEHYFFFRREAEKRQKQIIDLQERNEKLEEAVEILQKEQVSLKKACDKSKVKADDCKVQNVDENSFNSNEASPIASSDLNMAIHSENLLDASSLSYNSTQNETIAETESLGYSPQKLKATHSVWQKRREQTRCKKITSENGNDFDSYLKRTESQIKKDGLSKPLSMVNESVSKQNSTTLRDLINIKNERKINLSLNKNKLRQKRLEFEKEKNLADKIVEMVEDVIDSPVTTSKTKPTRNLLARKNSQEDNTINLSNQNQMANLTFANIKKDSKIPDDYLFDFNTTVSSPFKEKPCNMAINDSSLSLKLSLSTKTDASPSCVILTPATQDIVFIDEETDEELSDTSKDLKTMDIMAEVLKPDNESLTNLKRLEVNSIKKQQRRVMKQFDFDSNKTNATNLPKNIKQEKVTQPVLNDDITFIDEAALAQITTNISKKRELDEDTEDEDADLLKGVPLKIIKHENNMEPAVENPDNAMDSEDDEIFKMPLPIKIKKEKETCDKQLTYKDRFSIDCEDCEKYLDIVGDRLTDREIEGILRRCNHKRDLNNTPVGFWNPLLLSFADDDRRNEVLVDDRFVGKKRNS